MIFKTVELNVGNHFDAKTGVLTAPEEGMYCFRVGTAGPIHYPEISVSGYLMLEDGAVSLVQPWSKRVVLRVSPGQTVWVKADSPINFYDNTQSVHFIGTSIRCPPPPPLV
ncbi:hypothetical protein ACOMHN_015858 [Nucella lapillus]